MNIDVRQDQVSISPRASKGGRGGLCRKGWTAGELIGEGSRLRSPLIRDNRSSPLRPCSWSEALEALHDAISRSQAKYGPDSVGVFGGGGLTNEKAYYLGKLARVALGTRFIDYNGRFCMSSAATAINRSFGLDRGMPFPFEDIANAGAVFLAGSNMAETMPPAMRYLREQRERGGSLIVADPRRTPTAETATLHLQLRPGSDVALANGLLHIALEEGYVDEDFIAARTSGFDELEETIGSYWPARVEAITGVSIPALFRAAEILGQADSVIVLTARGAEQHASGVDMVTAYINLTLALGQAGRANCGFGTLTGQGNGQGGREHGQKADQLPGYRSLSEPRDRAHMAKVWGIDVDRLPQPGVSAYELLRGLGRETGVRCLLVMGSNPFVSAPNSDSIEKGLDQLDFLAVADLFLSETAAQADLVLPTAQWAEETGTMTNAEGKVLLRKRSVPPPAEVKTDLEIISDLARRLGYGDAFQSDPEDVFAELCAASEGGRADYSGLSYKSVEASDGVHWPCNAVAPLGTPRLFLETFSTPDGRARFYPTEHRGPREEPCEQYPYYLTTGRTLLQYQSGTQTRRVGTLTEGTGAFVEMHPLLAKMLKIEEGTLVRVSSRRGQAIVAARLSQNMRTDSVFMPFHWPNSERANLLTNPVLDPLSKMPEFKACAVSLAAVHAGSGI